MISVILIVPTLNDGIHIVVVFREDGLHQDGTSRAECLIL
jgi:hypothetical protein